MKRPALKVPQHGPGGTTELAPWLDAIGDRGRELVWSVDDLWALATASGDLTEWHAQPPDVADDDWNQTLQWEDLRRLAAASMPVIDGTFVGRIPSEPGRAVASIKRAWMRDGGCLWEGRVPFEHVSIYLEAFDSTCWYFWSREPELMQAARARFRSAVEIDLGLER